MIPRQLAGQLEAVAKRHRQRRLWCELSVCWAGLALAGFGLLHWSPAYGALIFPALIAAGLAAIYLRHRSQSDDYRGIAREVEKRHPELRTLLLAALDQKADPQTGELGFLQTRVIREAVAQSGGNRWHDTVPQKHLTWLRRGHFAGMTLAAVFFALLLAGSLHLHLPWSFAAKSDVEVTPGNIEIERGTPLTVIARFPKTAPAEVTLHLGERTENAHTIPLARNLGDPVFGATIPAVDASTAYHIEYAGGATPDYHVTVFDYPKLERADVRLVYPAYTKLPEKTVENTRVASAIEQTQMGWSLRLNKPVASARLVDKEGKTVPLAPDPNTPQTMRATFTPDQSRTYRLELVDDAGRRNKLADEFEIKVFPNKAPLVKVRLPAKEARVTPIEEVRFDAEVTDDFGLLNSGLSYALAGGPPKTINFPNTSEPQVKQHISHLLRLEEEGVKPNDLLTWYVWAEDIGPDGATRRTQSDVHFATVRHFEEIFRQMAGSGEGSQDLGAELIETQKQIVQSTWNVRRDEKAATPSADFSRNATLLRKSQELAIELAKNAAARVSGAEPRALLAEAQTQMSGAVAQLGEAESKNALPPLSPALDAENAAYRTLLKLAGKEWLVVQGKGQGQGNQKSAEEMAELDLKKQSDRYETERQAAPEISEAQKEQLQVLSRLRELAQRQRDLNDKLKELQVALQTAKTPEERAEIERELKRLRDKQQEMLSDMDQLAQRMNQPENSAPTAEARRQMEQSRESARRAADELEKKNAGNALAAGSRAEQGLAKLRDDFQKQTASEFSEQMRKMRDEARDLAQAQQQITDKLAGGSQPPPEKPSLRGSLEQKALAGELTGQGERLAKLLQNMRETTEAAEASEPALSRKLLDAVRRADQGQVAESLQQAAALTAQNARADAAPPAESARQGLEALKQDVDRAAASVLGDDVEKLRFAKAEIGELKRQVENEISAQEKGDQGKGGPSNPSAESQQGESETKKGENGKKGQNGQQSGEAKSGQNDREGQPGQTGRGERSREGEQGQQGQSGRAQNELDTGRGKPNGGAIGGEGYFEWSDRMRNVEETLQDPVLRDALVKARESARELRADYKRRSRLPEWNLVRTQIFAPLAEAESQLARELARRESKDPLATVERDPVPEKYSEVVRRYYEQLGK